MDILELKAVRKSFGGVVALNNVSFNVKEGEKLGLIGPNGAGKTTLFNCITGIWNIDQGSISFKGYDLTRENVISISKLGIGRTFQNTNLFNNLTVRDNILVGMCGKWKTSFLSLVWGDKYFKKKEMEIDQNINDILNLVRLTECQFHQAGVLPYGLQKRLEIARTLAARPDLLLLDEPVAGMNINETNEIINLIRDINENFRITIIIIEHDVKMIMKVSDRIIVLDQGALIASDTPENVRKDQKVIEAYLGRDNNYA